MADKVYAHCDTLNGPVVADARKALASGDITPLLKWVAAHDEQMIRTAFQKTWEVRKLGTQARDLADKALESGSVDKLTDTLGQAMVKGVRDRFQRALETQKHADENVSAGREFVEAYVIFTHYVEGIHLLIKGNTAHHEHK